MKRFGVNWLAIFGVNLVITIAVFSALVPSYSVIATFFPPTKPNWFLILWWGLYTFINPAISVARTYGSYKNAVEGKASTSWSPPETSPVAFATIRRQWLIWSSVLGIGFAAARFFTGQPPEWMVMLTAFLIPAIVLAAQTAQRRLYRSGILHAKNTLAIAVTPTDLATVIKTARSSISQNEEPLEQGIRNSR